MSIVSKFTRGSYRFLPSVFQYSAGIAALPGHEIQRVRFRNPVPFGEGFDCIEEIVRDAGRPLTALCACELRSPAPFTDEGFRAFNETYVAKLRQWGLFDGAVNPVARSNVCPDINPPKVPSFHAFCFTIEATRAKPTFVIAGSGEATEGSGSYGERASDAAKQVLTRSARRRAMSSERWNVALACSASAGPTLRSYRSILFTIFTRFLRTRSCRGARPNRV